MRFRTFLSIAAVLFCVTPAFSSSLQDWEFNVNGHNYYPGQGDSLGTVPGLNSSGFNATTGLGTLTLTFDPNVAGTFYIGAWFFVPTGTPFYNEYGAVNGSAGAGQNWQIDIPQYDASSANHGAGTIIDNLSNGTLSDTNSVPGQTSNYLHDCGADGGGPVTASCNDLVSMAQGFKFTLTKDQGEKITFDLSSSNPGGFSLEDIHPIDGSNSSASDVFYSASAAAYCTTNCGTPTAPEPATWTLLVAAGGMLALALGRRRSLRSGSRSN
jgi:hypothetical protein